MTARCSKRSVAHGVMPATATKLGMAKPPGPGLEADLDRHADGDVVGLAAAEPAGDPHAGMVGELDQHEGVRHLEVRQPALVVHGEAVDGARAGDLDRADGPAAARAADAARRERFGAAGRAALDEQAAFGGRGPERLRSPR